MASGRVPITNNIFFNYYPYPFTRQTSVPTPCRKIHYLQKAYRSTHKANSRNCASSYGTDGAYYPLSTLFIFSTR